MPDQTGQDTKVYGGCSSVGRALVCGTSCRRFEPGHPPHKIQTRILRVLILSGRVGFKPTKKSVEPQARGRREYAGSRQRTSPGGAAARSHTS